MARLARFVVPSLPHHVTQLGNRRETIFFSDDGAYPDFLKIETRLATLGFAHS